MLRLEANRVVDDVEMGRVDCALCGVLRDQIEIEPFRSCDYRVNNRATWRVYDTMVDSGEKASVYSFLHNYECH